MLTRYETCPPRGEALGRLARGTAEKIARSLAWLEGDFHRQLQARFDIAAIGVACAWAISTCASRVGLARPLPATSPPGFAEVSQRPSMQATRADPEARRRLLPPQTFGALQPGRRGAGNSRPIRVARRSPSRQSSRRPAVHFQHTRRNSSRPSNGALCQAPCKAPEEQPCGLPAARCR